MNLEIQPVPISVNVREECSMASVDDVMKKLEEEAKPEQLGGMARYGMTVERRQLTLKLYGPQQEELAKLIHLKRQMEGQIALFERVAKPTVEMGGVLKEISNAVPEQIIIRKMVFDDHTGLLGISGTTFSDKALYGFCDRLRNSDFFEGIKLDYSSFDKNEEYNVPALDFEVRTRILYFPIVEPNG